MKMIMYVWVYATQYEWEQRPTWYASACDPRKYASDIVHAEQQRITVDVPEQIDITAGRIAALKVQADEVRAEFSARINEINDQIRKLEALEAPKECAND